MVGVIGPAGVIEQQHVGARAAGQVNGAVGLRHGVSGGVVLDEASLATPRAVVGVGIAIVEGDGAGMEGDLHIAAEVEIALGERRVVR